MREHAHLKILCDLAFMFLYSIQTKKMLAFLKDSQHIITLNFPYIQLLHFSMSYLFSQKPPESYHLLTAIRIYDNS